MKYVSLFSGIGGFELGIHRSFPQAECIGYSEIDPVALKVYEQNFPGHRALGDVRQVSGNLGVQLIVGGSPCTNLTIKSTLLKEHSGLRGSRSGLFYEYVRIVKENNCYFILENVASMTKANRDDITSILGAPPIMLNSNIVCAQNRRRLYWTNLPIDRDVLATMQESNQTVKDILDPVPAVEGLLINPQSKDLERYLQNKNLGFYAVSESNNKKTRCLTTNKNWIYDHRIDKFRKYSTNEMERLQTLPSKFLQSTSQGNSQRLIGNSVTPDIIQLILLSLPQHFQWQI